MKTEVFMDRSEFNRRPDKSVNGVSKAAMQIYKASSSVKVSPVRFFEKNDVAMEDMRRCAAEEAAS